MTNKLKVAWMSIRRCLDYLLWAAYFGLLMYVYWFLFPNMFTAHIWNIVGISVVLIIDKRRINGIYRKLETCTDSEILFKLRKKDVSSIKTSLYLFYISSLFVSQMAVMTDINLSDHLQGYLQSVSYGVIFLIALDKFFEYLSSDNKRIKKYHAQYEAKCGEYDLP